MEEQERAKKEWYVVDWDETHPQSGVSTHQAITSAMNKWQPKDNSRVQQFQVSQGQPTTRAAANRATSAAVQFPTLTAVPSQINRSVDLYIPHLSKGAQKARTNLSELNVKIKQLQEQLRKAKRLGGRRAKRCPDLHGARDRCSARSAAGGYQTS